MYSVHTRSGPKVLSTLEDRISTSDTTTPDIEPEGLNDNTIYPMGFQLFTSRCTARKEKSMV